MDKLLNKTKIKLKRLKIKRFECKIEYIYTSMEEQSQIKFFKRIEACVKI